MKTELITPPDTQPELPPFPRFYRHNASGGIWAQVKPGLAIRMHSNKVHLPVLELQSGESANHWEGYTLITTPFTIKFTP